MFLLRCAAFHRINSINSIHSFPFSILRLQYFHCHCHIGTTCRHACLSKATATTLPPAAVNPLPLLLFLPQPSQVHDDFTASTCPNLNPPPPSSSRANALRRDMNNANLPPSIDLRQVFNSSQFSPAAYEHCVQIDSRVRICTVLYVFHRGAR